MLNQVIIVGRIQGFEPFGIVVAIPRYYKNENGEYDTDIIPCELTGNILTNTKEYCNVGDIVGVKGHLESQGISIIIKGEKITFLSSTHNTEGGE